MDVEEHKLGNEQVDEVESVLVYLAPVLGWGHDPCGKAGESGDEFPKNEVHERQDDASANGSKASDAVECPARLVCIPKDTLRDISTEGIPLSQRHTR